MENQDNFKSAGKSWDNKEDQQLINEYTVDKLNLLEICEIHKRKPGGISSRLKRLNLIDMKQNVRGYSEYKKSDLYKLLKNEKIITPSEIVKPSLNELLIIMKDIQYKMNMILEKIQ